MGGFAWVTLATNDSYSLGALVLANSLKQVGTKEQLAVLVTPGVTSSMKEKLSQVFNVVYEVNILDSKDAANLRLLQRPELGITFTKLHCWRLVQFDKCVFLDADTLVLQNCDELFEREELSAAPDVGWPDCFNSGVFVFRPSNETYEKLIQFALDKGSFDGGDQGLLNLYFSDWATKDISKHLPFIYNLCSTACYSYLPAFKQFGGNAKIMHFIGASKPWLQYFDTESRKVQPSNDLRHLEGILQHWWNIFCQLIHPNLSTDMARSTQDVAHSSNSHRTPANSQKPRTHSKKNIAWDPWEEYDKNQSALQNPPQTEPYSHEKLIESHNTIASNVVNETPQPHTFAPPHNILPHQHHPPPPQNYVPPQQHHAHVSPLQTYIPLNNSLQSQPYIPPPQPAIPPKQSYIPPVQSQSHMTPPSQNQAQPQPHFSSQINNIPSTRDPSPPASQLTNNPSPPKNDPVPPNECEAASTVCKEITMHAPEDETNGGLAGAFAQLTLGAPRTSEQLALDDHLRRQGWEVGNIDYMGRDSFDNIWSKICQTIGTSVSSKEATPPPPPPPVEEPSPVPASEAAVPSAPEATSEPIASLPEISPSCNIQTISIEIAPITTIEPIPLPQTSIEPEKPTELIEQSPTLPPSQETSVAAQKTEKSIPATTDAPQQTTEPPKTTEAIPELSQPVVCPCKPPPPPFPEVQPTPETVPSVPKLTASPPKILSTELLIEPISPTPDVVPITEPKTDTKASETIESVKSEPELEKTISQPIQQTLQSATPISESTNIPAESKQIAPEPAKPASEPTKPATEPAKPVSEPTKPATEPAKPTLEPVKPASEPVKPVSEPVKPASEPAKPTSEPVAESTKPASKLTESVKPGPEPTKPVSEPDKVVPEVQKSSSEITKPLSETIKPASKSSKPLSEPTKQISKSTKAAPEAPKPQTDAPKSTKPAAESGKTTKESPACAKPVEPLQASAASTKNVPVPESSKPEDTAAETSKTKAGDASQTSPTPPPRKTGGVKKTKAKK